MIDSLRAHKTVIGTVTVTEPFEVTALHAYAAHFTQERVECGTYAVTVCSEYAHHVNGRATQVRPHYVVVEYDTTILAESWDQERYRNRRGLASTHRAEHYAYTCPRELTDDAVDGVPWFGGTFHRSVIDGARFEPSGTDGARPIVTLAD